MIFTQNSYILHTLIKMRKSTGIEVEKEILDGLGDVSLFDIRFVLDNVGCG